MILTILRGVSGSGKSTWASQQNAMVVSRDTIRLAQPGELSDVDEGLVTAQQYASIRYGLERGRDVIVDDTNIYWGDVVRLANLGRAYGAEIELGVFDIPLENCILNNDKRAAMGGRFVPHKVIKKQYERLQGNKDKGIHEILYE